MCFDSLIITDPCSITLQRFWRGHCGRKASKSLKAEDIRRDKAAFKIQKWWYSINGQFTTFLLMRLLAFQDKMEEEQSNQERKSLRTQALILMQEYARRWSRRKKINQTF